MNMTLPARPPFSLSTMIRSHGWIQLAPFASDDAYQTFSYVARLATGRVVSLHVQQEGDGVRVTANSDLDEDERTEVADKVTWAAALGQDLTPFHTMARSEPKLAHVVERAQGRILRSPTLFEDTVKTILTTNTAWGGTRRMVQSLVDLYGQPLAEDSSRRAFPTPERLADVDAETLRQEAKLGYRAPYVRELAQRVATGDLDLEALKTADLPTPELRKELLAIKGVGNYAAANLLMLLGRSDFIPIDSYAMKMVSNEFHDGEPIGAKEVEAAFADWGEWKGMAFWFWDWSPIT